MIMHRGIFAAWRSGKPRLVNLRVMLRPISGSPTFVDGQVILIVLGTHNNGKSFQTGLPE